MNLALKWLFLALALTVPAGTAIADRPKTVAPQVSKQYDLVVAGAGTGGCSAAIQAARMGIKVALLEETGVVGGQMVACGVTTMDDQRLNRSGIYKEFIDRLNKHYSSMSVNNAICYWNNNTISGSPKDEQEILLEMLKEAGVDLFLHAQIDSVQERSGTVVGLTWHGSDGNRHTMPSKVLIDATECGDVLPLTSARYRVGNSISPNIDMNANIQDITWVAIVHKTKTGVPDDLRIPFSPPGYAEVLPRFSKIFAVNGHTWPLGVPYDIPTFNAYRAIPDPDWNLPINGRESSTWHNVTATALNWGNDYPGNDRNIPGLTVRYLEDKQYRKEVNSEALNRTLDLLYYYQKDLMQDDWTVDTRQGYDKTGDRPEDITVRLPTGYNKIVANMPPRPYVRESRRLVGVRTLTVSDVRRDQDSGKVDTNHPSSIAVGEYPIDIHGSHMQQFLEADLGEKESDFHHKWRPGRFQVPVECLIPEKLDGFLAAEKNISVSRMVNGSIRLHPITMLVGQAAGALSALAIKNGIQPRQVPVMLVQKALLEGKSLLSLLVMEDVFATGRNWAGVQMAVLYGWLPSMWDRMYAEAFVVKAGQLKAALAMAFPKAKPLQVADENKEVSLEEFKSIIASIAGSYTNWQKAIDPFAKATLARGTTAAVIADIKFHEAEEQLGKERTYLASHRSAMPTNTAPTVQTNASFGTITDNYNAEIASTASGDLTVANAPKTTAGIMPAKPQAPVSPVPATTPLSPAKPAYTAPVKLLPTASAVPAVTHPAAPAAVPEPVAAKPVSVSAVAPTLSTPPLSRTIKVDADTTVIIGAAPRDYRTFSAPLQNQVPALQPAVTSMQASTAVPLHPVSATELKKTTVSSEAAATGTEPAAYRPLTNVRPVPPASATKPTSVPSPAKAAASPGQSAAQPDDKLRNLSVNPNKPFVSEEAAPIPTVPVAETRPAAPAEPAYRTLSIDRAAENGSSEPKAYRTLPVETQPNNGLGEENGTGTYRIIGSGPSKTPRPDPAEPQPQQNATKRNSASGRTQTESSPASAAIDQIMREQLPKSQK